MQKYFSTISILALFMTFICCCNHDSVSNNAKKSGNETKEVVSANKDKKMTTEKPDTLIYCSIADESPAGGSKNYIELINENGKTELIAAYDLNNDFGRPSSKDTYTLTAEDAAALLKVIKENNILDAKVTPESQIEMPGAKQYRVRIEISGREVFTLKWYKVCEGADAVYLTLKHQFSELIQKYKK